MTPTNVDIVEIADVRKVLSSSIRERAQHGSRGSCTKHYVVKDDGIEIAFLSVDPRPDLNLLVIYEIFVPPELRRQGIGTRVLLAAENLARESGFLRTRLIPKALGYPPGDEREAETARLIEWYERHGYRTAADSGFREWQKTL